MDSNPAGYQYGLTSAGVDNVHASFVGMTQHERSRMHFALLRVIARILMDIARAATSAMVELREEEVDVEVDEHALVQKLPEDQAAKLRKASAKVEIQGLLGTEREKLGRSLLASLDRMQVEEARRCAQNLLQKLFRHYGVLPDTACEHPPEDVTAGPVVYGADISTGEVTGTSMDEYFVNHSWNLMASSMTVPNEGAMVPTTRACGLKLQRRPVLGLRWRRMVGQRPALRGT